MKKTEEAIKNLFDVVDEQKETLLVLHIDEKDKYVSHWCGKPQNIAAGIATTVYDGLKDVSDDESQEMLAKAIVDGVLHVMKMPSISAIRLLLRLKKAMEKVDRKKGNEEQENCGDCECNRWCPMPEAIKYRKENHITEPKKGKNKKRKKEELN